MTEENKTETVEAVNSTENATDSSVRNEQDISEMDLDDILVQQSLQEASGIQPETAEEENKVPVPEAHSSDSVGIQEQSQINSETQDQEEIPQEVNWTKPNVMMHFDVSGPRDRGAPDVLALPPESGEAIKSALERVPNINLAGTEKQAVWAATLQEGMSYLPLAGAYTERLGDGSKWTQSVNYQGKELHGRAPAVRKKEGVEEVQGERALLQLVTHLGVGGLFHAPMWNSGFWVYFKPATEVEMLELNAMIAAEKIRLGRNSYGLAHSNHIVYMLDRVFQMALRHVYATSVKSEELPISQIGNHLMPQDIHSFVWGFLCANYPSGFHYSVACVSNPEKCNAVFEGNINLTKLQQTDEGAFTEWQLNHMTGYSANSKSLDSVKRYQEEMKRQHERRLVINKGTNHEIAITLKTPTVSQYIEQGTTYISSMVDGINRSLDADVSNQERNIRLEEVSRASLLCQYVHFVKSIEFGNISTPGGGYAVINDFDTILNALKTFSATDSLREEIIEAILKYIMDSTTSIIAMPAFDCPFCKEPQEKNVKNIPPRLKAFIPIDIFQVFFGLLVQRVSRIKAR